MPYPIGFLVLLTALLVAAAVLDGTRRRIPNVVNGLVAATGVAAQALGRGWGHAGLAVLAGLAVIVLLWVPWTRGRVGGGDVKLAGAAAVWCGLGLLPVFLGASAVAGGLVALVCYMRSGDDARAEMRANLAGAAAGVMPEAPIRGGAGRVSVPYGIGVAIGALSVLWVHRFR